MAVEVNIRIEQASPADFATPLLVLQHFERDMQPGGLAADVDQRLGGAITRLLARGDFQGRKDETALLYPQEGQSGAERLLRVGVGKREDYVVERLRRAVGTAIRAAEKLGVTHLALSTGHVNRLSEHMGAYYAGRAAVESAVLAAWYFGQLKTEDDDAPRSLVK